MYSKTVWALDVSIGADGSLEVVGPTLGAVAFHRSVMM